ncbi:MAG: hypothetical protein M1814_001802 [Vezdaea aestivalis]|nr:MAG: hypothetical protein M1814_001802 [Vezdaea aestivalis]
MISPSFTLDRSYSKSQLPRLPTFVSLPSSPLPQLFIPQRSSPSKTNLQAMKHRLHSIPMLLGGTQASFYMSDVIDNAKPTIVLINSLFTSAKIFEAQFEDQSWTKAANLICIEPLGHGKTRCNSSRWTTYDIAQMNIVVVKSLGVEKAFALGTSGGGAIAVAMAILDPILIEGVIPMNASMDSESPRSRELKCWNADEILTPYIDEFSKPQSTDFQVPLKFCQTRIKVGFGSDFKPEVQEALIKDMQEDYAGDEGRKRLVSAAICMRDRSSLHDRLYAVRCPVLWLHGAGPSTFSVDNARAEIQLFSRSEKATLQVIAGSQHLLAGPHAPLADKLIIDFVQTWHK